jgi:hypothetical protein
MVSFLRSPMNRICRIARKIAPEEGASAKFAKLKNSIAGRPYHSLDTFEPVP